MSGRTFTHDGEVVTPRVIDHAISDAWSAFAVRDYARAERLALVTEFLVRREAQRLQVDPAR
jgi:hypothetical protein